MRLADLPGENTAKCPLHINPPPRRNSLRLQAAHTTIFNEKMAK
jgi:hypothetical protein